MGPEFNKSLRKVARPKLESLGFKFDGKRRFMKVGHDGHEQIIEYQVGTRATQGQFAVNLISGKRFERLATIRPTLMSRLVNWLFGDFDPWWKGIFLPKDDWWQISPFQKGMDSIIKNTVADLEGYQGNRININGVRLDSSRLLPRWITCCGGPRSTKRG